MLILDKKSYRRRLACVLTLFLAALFVGDVAYGLEVGSLAEGKLVVWGFDEYGQVSEANRAGIDFVQVVGGHYHTLALRSDSSLSAWGYDDNLRVSGPKAAGGGFTDVAGGEYHSLALRYDGSITAWGYDTYGEVSGPNNADDGYIQLAAGSGHSLALHSDGTLAAWGYDSQGQVSGPNGAGGGFMQVSAKALQSLALRTNGTIEAWGYNNHGQVSGPDGATGFTQVAAGVSHSLGLRTNGTIAAWGYNNFGQVSGPNGAGSGFVQVAGGEFHTLALRDDGSLAAWGSDGYGEVSGPNNATGFYTWIDCGYRQSYAIEARQQYDDLLVRDAYYFTDMDTLLQRDLTLNGNFTVEAPLTVVNSPTVTVQGSTTVGPGGVLDVDGSWTLDTSSIAVKDSGQLNAAGTVDTRIRSYAGSIVAATGDLVLGDGTFQAVTLDGQLDVGAHTVTLNKQGFTNIGGVATIDGGTLEAPNGLRLGIDSYLTGGGTVDGRVAASTGSTIHATGDLTLGDVAEYAGFFSEGELYTEDNEVVLNSLNTVVLGPFTQLGDAGNPGTLTSATGAIVDFGKSIVGYGTIDTPDDAGTPLIVNGLVAGNSGAQPITLNGYVKGVGTLSNVVIAGTLSPGLSPAEVDMVSPVLGDTATLIMELGGTDPGGQYDVLNISEHIGLDGTLDVVLINRFKPREGDVFDLFNFSDFSGQFDTVNLPGLADGLRWDDSKLLVDGTLSVSLVPEPSTFVLLLLAASGLLIYRNRQ